MLWRGIWFQQGVRPYITITQDRVSSKGVCQARSEGHVLLERRTGHQPCYTCLVFHITHTNLIHYKESKSALPLLSSPHLSSLSSHLLLWPGAGAGLSLSDHPRRRSPVHSVPGGRHLHQMSSSGTSALLLRLRPRVLQVSNVQPGELHHLHQDLTEVPGLPQRPGNRDER